MHERVEAGHGDAAHRRQQHGFDIVSRSDRSEQANDGRNRFLSAGA